jgi:hypothetical protein
VADVDKTGSWMPLDVSTCYGALRTVAKRFPVPQDNFVPVAISSDGLVGFTTQIGSDGKFERDSEGFSAPLISGSGAMMPLPNGFVNYFVVAFE